MKKDFTDGQWFAIILGPVFFIIVGSILISEIPGPFSSSTATSQTYYIQHNTDGGYFLITQWGGRYPLNINGLNISLPMGQCFKFSIKADIISKQVTMQATPVSLIYCQSLPPPGAQQQP